MDLSLLTTPVSEYNKQQRTGVLFTVRSANSPSYSLTHRPGLRTPRALPKKERENTEEARERKICREEEQGSLFTQSQIGTNKKNHAVTRNQDRTGNYTGVGAQGEKGKSDHKTSSLFNQNGTIGKKITETGSDTSGSSDPASRGRTEWRRHNLPSRSKSLDRRGGASSPDRGTKADTLVFSRNQGGVSPKQAESLVKIRAADRDRVTGMENRGMSTAERSPVDDCPKAYVGPGLSRISQNVERAGEVHSLPSRLKAQACSRSGLDSSSGFRETATSFAPKGRRSISERIEKLYGLPLSEGEGQSTTAHRRSSTSDSPLSPPANQRTKVSYEGERGGTFPRRSSMGDKNNLSPVQIIKTVTCRPVIDTNTSVSPDNSVSPVSPVPSWTRERAPGGQWQIQGRWPEEGGVQCGRGAPYIGTRSPDRVINANLQPHPFLEDESSTSFRYPSASREGRASGSKEKDTANSGKEKGAGDKINGHAVLKEQGKEKGIDDRVKEEKGKEENGMKSSSLTDHVFESNTQKISLKTTEKKKLPDTQAGSSAANVRNKIHQYEAMTQKAQGSATGQFRTPRRAFSVPAELSGTQEGVKKSGSERAIGGLRGRWEGLREGGEGGNKTADEERVTGVKKSASERVLAVIRSEIPEENKKTQRGSNQWSAAVDEVGIRPGNRERKGVVVVERVGNQQIGSGNYLADDFGKYSRLKHALGINLNAEAKRHRDFYIDETDFTRATSPEKSTRRDLTANDASTSLLANSADSSIISLHTPEPPGVQSSAPPGIPSPVSDEDKTPTNTPHISPFSSHRSLSESTITMADIERETAAKYSLPIPITASSHQRLPDLVHPDGSTPDPKGENQDEHLDAWVASLNLKIESWDDDDDDDEGTEKDEDSDSDSAESSVTITSNMSQSDRRSFCVSLADLCNFGGVDYESSDNDSDEWPSGRRSASLSSDVSALSCVSVMPNEELDRLLEDVRGLGDSTLQNYDDVQVVVLHKEVGVGLGFTVAGGVDQNKPITVHKVIPSGVAAQEGSITEGDQVLSINGTALCGSTHLEALRTLRRAKTRGMGVVVLKRGKVSSSSQGGAGADAQGRTQTRPTETGQRVCVRLDKHSRDLGFSLEGGVGSNLGDRPLSIQKIFQGGPFSKVCPGDEVLEIQGVSVVGMRRLEVWTLIRKLPPGPVDVVLQRPLKPPET